MSQSLVSRLYSSLTEAIDHRVGWDKLPTPLGLLTFVGIRNRLRARNLYDSGRGSRELPPADDALHRRHLTSRTLDGTYNDLADPLIGSIGSRFGRNVPLEWVYPDPDERLLSPNPRTISLELLTRDVFKPATTLNVLAAAWIQFEVHDWFSHGENERGNEWMVELSERDDWLQRPMLIPRARRDPSPDDGGPPSFLTADTHWWDGSQIYGNTVEFAEALRSGKHGRLRIDDSTGLPPEEIESQLDLQGVAGNFWVGLALLHALFMLEHNAICDRLHAKYPSLDDDEVYAKARLVNAALMAKIHTVDWTPALIAHPTTILALRTNWWGLFGERFMRSFGRRTKSELIHGIPGSRKRVFGVPYSLTEEFVAVYRMHPLIPDDYVFHSLAGDKQPEQRTFPELDVRHVRKFLKEIPLADAFYSFGIANPGRITLHNYPRFLQTLKRSDEIIDLAATDIVRTRERGVPRYNDFRRLFHLQPIRTFDELTPNREWAEEMASVYKGEIEDVDLMIGLYAEPFPEGFGFSDTAFRVFVLMASRRLEADRFFTDDYRPEIYTPHGIEWVESNNMRSVLLRHLPQLEPALRGVQNPFAPWNRVK
jgi:hypothetical protein